MEDIPQFSPFVLNPRQSARFPQPQGAVRGMQFIPNPEKHDLRPQGAQGLWPQATCPCFFGDLFHITKTSITYYHVISCPCFGHLFHTTLKRVSAGGEIEIVWGGDKRKAFTTSFTNPWSMALGADTKRVITIIRGKIWAAPKHSGVGDETTYWKLFRMCLILEELE